MTAAKNAEGELKKLNQEAQMLRDRITSDTSRLEVIGVQIEPLKKLVAQAASETPAKATK